MNLFEDFRNITSDQIKILLSFVHQVHDVVVVTDASGVIEYVNPSFEKVTGYTSEEIIGQTTRVLDSGKQDEYYYESMWKKLREGEVFRGAFIQKKKSGELYHEELVVTPIKDDSGKVAHFISIGRDISDHKKMEGELKEAKEQAISASQAKSDFLANMSHEIRTPMNGIIGMLGLLSDTMLTPEQNEYTQTIKSSADALLTVINDILDFSKIEAGKLEIEPIPFDLHLAIDESAELLAVKAREKNIQLIVRYHPDAPRRVVGDPGRIRQVLNNLVGNAIKFTEKGQVLVNIEYSKGGGKQPLFQFSVEDSGMGIEEDKLGVIFDQFTQADTSTTRNFGGTGLGLAISKQLVELMGGRIGASSTLGQGSVFWFRIPMKVDHRNFDPIPKEDLSGVKVLVIDDNEINRKVLTEQLASWNIQSEDFSTSAEALAALHNGIESGTPFDMAILDYQVPGMDGEMMARAIKSDPKLKDTVLLLLTSVGVRGDAKKFHNIGFAAYLVKPVRQLDLRDALSAAWAMRNAEGETAIITKHSLREGDIRPPLPEDKDENQDLSKFHCTAKVLYAEDNLVNQKVGKIMFEKLGCEVEIANNGAEAVEKIEKESYDIVFMDCSMPEMDGYEATQKIRHLQSEVSRIPIIAVTANVMEGDRERCLAAGMDDYVSKPVKQEALIMALKKWAPTNGESSEEGVEQSDQKDKKEKSEKEQSTLESSMEEELSIDHARLDNLREFAGDDDGSFIKGLFETYFTSANERLVEMKKAFDSGDAEMLGREAHGLKGSSANLGVNKLARVSKELEMMGKAGSTDGASDLLQLLENELTVVRQEFEDKIKNA